MLKRDLPKTAIRAEGPHTKKRRDGISLSENISTDDRTANGDAKAGDRASAVKDRELANSQGVVLWQTVKDAVNKENRVLSVDFMQRPSKRLYPDYYKQIARPTSLEDIKKRLDAKSYPSFEAVRQDLELCFTNAKLYNQRNSQIWKDAKHLHKLVLREYARINPSEEDKGDDEVDGGSQSKGDDPDDQKKSKGPSMYRLLKSRLTKLVEKTDDSGRVLSEVFMELPSKKLWPFYYKEIKRPQCLENIFKHLKRREYETVSDFAADVELVFSNALQFNQDHSTIWEDAKTLRDYFQQLMSDLPPPFALPDYSKPSKIKLKVPPIASAQTAITSSPQLPSSNAVTSSGSLRLRVPAASVSTETQKTSDAKQKTASVATPAASAAQPSTGSQANPSPAATTASARTPAVAIQPKPASLATPPPPPPAASGQPPSHPNSLYSQHYPNASYISPAGTSTAPNPTASSFGNSLLNRTLPTRSATPPLRTQHPLQIVSLRVEPNGRPFTLDYLDGVKSWALRLHNEEKALAISNVKFLAGEEEESSEEEEDGGKEGEEEEEEDVDVEADVPAKRARKKGKARGRGRKKAAAALVHEKGKVKESPKKTKKIMPSLEDVQVKMNGVQIDIVKGEWNVELPIGLSVVEVGAKEGMIWKVFAERTQV